MQSPIVPVGLTSSEVLPGIYIETNFAMGPGVGTGLKRALIVLANKLPGGAATENTELYGPDTPTQLISESQMIYLAAAGSEAHRMFRRLAAVTGGENGPPVYWLFVPESSGAKATLDITIATNATGPGTYRLWVGDEFVDTGISLGSTPTEIAAALVSAISGKTHWPVTATNAAGVLTVTAKQKGLRGNFIRVQAAILASQSIAMTTTAQADTFLAGGTGSDSNALALATINASWYYHIVSAAEDATQVGAASSQVATQALAMNGLRQRLFYGSVDTLAATITNAIGVNNHLAEVIWSEKSPWTPAEIAANAAMVYAIGEADELGFRTNWIGFGNDAETKPLWKMPASRVVSARPGKAALRSALQNGITPIGVNPNGTTYIVDRFTTRSLNGSVPETRIREAHKVTIIHRFADAFNARLQAAGAGKTIADDPPDGLAPVAGTITPKICRGLLNLTYDEFAAAGKLQSGINPETGLDRLLEQKTAARVQRETNPSSRMGIRAPVQTIDNFRQAAFIVDQVA